MMPSPKPPARWVKTSLCAAGILLVMGLIAPAPLAADRRSKEVAADLRFAREMAEQRLWREAIFRWERVLAALPPDSEEAGRVLNNVAVAAEALGKFEKARGAYEKAVTLTRDREIAANFELFERAHPRPQPDAAGAPKDAVPAEPAEPGGAGAQGDAGEQREARQEQEVEGS